MTDLLAQLVDMRARLVGNLAKQIDGGCLALLNSVSGAIQAVEAERRAPPLDADQGARAVVSDPPCGAITLALYSEDGSAMTVPLAPQRAIALAGELIRAAMPRLG